MFWSFVSLSFLWAMYCISQMRLINWLHKLVGISVFILKIFLGGLWYSVGDSGLCSRCVLSSSEDLVGLCPIQSSPLLQTLLEKNLTDLHLEEKTSKWKHYSGFKRLYSEGAFINFGDILSSFEGHQCLKITGFRSINYFYKYCKTCFNFFTFSP